MIHPDTLLEAVQANVEAALREDVGDGDISAALIDVDVNAQARVITREPGIFCGVPWVEATLRAVDAEASLTWRVDDGTALQAGDVLFELQGRARSLLTAERTMLNFAQLLSGTATLTHRHYALIKHTNAKLLDTRKTLPGLRVAQKYAVRAGGGHNHRMGLFDAYLLKENHISAAGSITAAVRRARELKPDVKVEVEVERLEQLEEAMQAGADIAMVDNFDVPTTRQAVAMAAGRIELEASGNVDETSIAEIAETGVDYISMGKLTKDVQPLDLSMRFV